MPSRAGPAKDQNAQDKWRCLQLKTGPGRASPRIGKCTLDVGHQGFRAIGLPRPDTLVPEEINAIVQTLLKDRTILPVYRVGLPRIGLQLIPLNLVDGLKRHIDHGVVGLFADDPKAIKPAIMKPRISTRRGGRGPGLSVIVAELYIAALPAHNTVGHDSCSGRDIHIAKVAGEASDLRPLTSALIG